jgi:phosphoglucomutase
VSFRENPPEAIDGSPVEWIEDYESATARNILTGERRILQFPRSNVLLFKAQDGTRMAARPSGTEPKIKFYFTVNAPLPKPADFMEVGKRLDAKLERIIRELKLA